MVVRLLCHIEEITLFLRNSSVYSLNFTYLRYLLILFAGFYLLTSLVYQYLVLSCLLINLFIYFIKWLVVYQTFYLFTISLYYSTPLILQKNTIGREHDRIRLAVYTVVLITYALSVKVGVDLIGTMNLVVNNIAVYLKAVYLKATNNPSLLQQFIKNILRRVIMMTESVSDEEVEELLRGHWCGYERDGDPATMDVDGASDQSDQPRLSHDQSLITDPRQDSCKSPIIHQVIDITESSPKGASAQIVNTGAVDTASTGTGETLSTGEVDPCVMGANFFHLTSIFIFLKTQ